jgi:hypothetical protein
MECLLLIPVTEPPYRAPAIRVTEGRRADEAIRDGRGIVVTAMLAGFDRCRGRAAVGDVPPAAPAGCVAPWTPGRRRPQRPDSTGRRRQRNRRLPASLSRADLPFPTDRSARGRSLRCPLAPGARGSGCGGPVVPAGPAVPGARRQSPAVPAGPALGLRRQESCGARWPCGARRFGGGGSGRCPPPALRYPALRRLWSQATPQCRGSGSFVGAPVAAASLSSQRGGVGRTDRRS